MAVYFNLAVDCDQNESLAQRIAEAFEGFVIATKDHGDFVCRAEHIPPKCYWGHPDKPSDAGDWHTVCVEPCGMSWAGMSKGSRPSRLTNDSIVPVREALYRVLADPANELHGYRSAIYGCEAQDDLGDADWPSELDQVIESANLEYLHGLIVAKHLAAHSPLAEHLEEFSSDYLWCPLPTTI